MSKGLRRARLPGSSYPYARGCRPGARSREVYLPSEGAQWSVRRLHLLGAIRPPTIRRILKLYALPPVYRMPVCPSTSRISTSAGVAALALMLGASAVPAAGQVRPAGPAEDVGALSPRPASCPEGRISEVLIQNGS